jgi:hypothetical protein
LTSSYGCCCFCHRLVRGGVRRRDQHLVGHDGWGPGTYVSYVVYLTNVLLYDERCFTCGFGLCFLSPSFPRHDVGSVVCQNFSPTLLLPLFLPDFFVLLGLQYEDLVMINAIIRRCNTVFVYLLCKTDPTCGVRNAASQCENAVSQLCSHGCTMRTQNKTIATRHTTSHTLSIQNITYR